MPKCFAGALIDCIKATVGLAIEHKSTGGCEDAGPGFGASRAGLRDLPDDFARFDIDGTQEALAGFIGISHRFTDALFESEEIVEVGERAEGGGIPIGGIRGATVWIYDDWAAVGPDGMSPIDSTEKWLGQQKFAASPIKNVEEAVTVGMQQEMAGSPSVGCINKYGRLCGIAVKQVVRSELIMPLQFARFGIESKNRVGIEIIAGAAAVVRIGKRIAGGPVECAGDGIVGAGKPS
jgi:hypothetical protein